jgi:hypothetical protein
MAYRVVNRKQQMATREWMCDAITVLETLKYNKTKGKEMKGKKQIKP